MIFISDRYILSEKDVENEWKEREREREREREICVGCYNY